MKLKTKTPEFIAEFALGCMDAEIAHITKCVAGSFVNNWVNTPNLLKTYFTVFCKKCEKPLYMTRGGVHQGFANVPVTHEFKCTCPCGEVNVFNDNMYAQITGNWCDKYSAINPFNEKNVGSLKSKTIRSKLLELYKIAYFLELEYLESLDNEKA